MGFEVGRTYNRRQDIHGRFGGQQQGGIITPAGHPIIILIAGEAGSEHGYDDRYRPDGVFEYFGEGQTGDMRFRAGNKAILEHSLTGKSLLLFRKVTDGLKFEGEMVCEGYHIEPALDRDANQRNAIVFELRPLNAITEQTDADNGSADGNLDVLRQSALNSAAVPDGGRTSLRNVYQRSAMFGAMFWPVLKDIAKAVHCPLLSNALMAAAI